MSVCEKTVPATIGICAASAPSRWRVRTTYARGLADAPGKTAEPITPIIVARITGGQRIGVSGSAARSTSCQEIARIKSESLISANAAATQPGLAVTSACPIFCRPRRESAKATRPTSSSAATSRLTRLRANRRRAGGGFSLAPIVPGLSNAPGGAGRRASYARCRMGRG